MDKKTKIKNFLWVVGIYLLLFSYVMLIIFLPSIFIKYALYINGATETKLYSFLNKVCIYSGIYWGFSVVISFISTLYFIRKAENYKNERKNNMY